MEALILVRLPQIPSSRAWGHSPVFSFDEYRARSRRSGRLGSGAGAATPVPN